MWLAEWKISQKNNIKPGTLKIANKQTQFLLLEQVTYYENRRAHRYGLCAIYWNF